MLAGHPPGQVFVGLADNDVFRIDEGISCFGRLQGAMMLIESIPQSLPIQQWVQR